MGNHLAQMGNGGVPSSELVNRMTGGVLAHVTPTKPKWQPRDDLSYLHSWPGRYHVHGMRMRYVCSMCSAVQEEDGVVGKEA